MGLGLYVPVALHALGNIALPLRTLGTGGTPCCSLQKGLSKTNPCHDTQGSPVALNTLDLCPALAEENSAIALAAQDLSFIHSVGFGLSRIVGAVEIAAM